MSYIVKNCPAILPMTKLCDSESIFNCGTYCKDCTDCVIKQVIDKLREADASCDGINCTECSGFYMCHSQLANEILQLFDIEEINK